MSLQELESEVSISDINELPSIKHGWRILNFHAIPNQISIDLWDFPATAHGAAKCATSSGGI